jgi:hypothetical protein
MGSIGKALPAQVAQLITTPQANQYLSNITLGQEALGHFLLPTVQLPQAL